jgi:FdhD protein
MTPATARLATLTPQGVQDQSLPEEVPVAFVYNGGTQAVMMATPQDIADLARGFTLTEGIAPADALPEVEVIETPHGIEARMWLAAPLGAALAERRRGMLGPVGCGLCGIDSLGQALRPLPRLPAGSLHLTAAELSHATDSLRGHQPLHDETRAVHAAGFYMPGRGIVCAREDVGRHNALDKLIGALIAQGIDASKGAVVMTSRLSVDMVQKAVMAGAPVLLAVSAPTAHAVRLAEDAGLTLASTARGQIRIYSHANRITGTPHVA